LGVTDGPQNPKHFPSYRRPAQLRRLAPLSGGRSAVVVPQKPEARLSSSVGMVAAPDPHQRIRQCLLENAAVAVVGCTAEYEPVIIALGLKCLRRAFA